MVRLRRLLVVLVVLGALAGFGSSRALAATPPPDCTITEPHWVGSQHFDVYYNGDPTKPNYITETQAGNIAASAEQAYAAYRALGFPTPAVDPLSGTIQIQVLDLTPWSLSSVICFGSFDFNAATVGAPEEQYAVGADVFAEVEYFLYTPGFTNDFWLTQGASSWAAWKAFDYPAMSATDIGPPEMSLDCYDELGFSKCSKNGFENLGQSRWPFYEYLAEKFGVTFISEVLADAETANDPLVGLQTALVAHGTTLTAEYNAYATKLMAGGWNAPSLNVAALKVSGAPILTGAATGDISPKLFNVNHLATSYVEFDRGDGLGDHACYEATLTITVLIPAGVASQPAFYWGGGSSVDLAVSGNTATATVPWDTCLWANKGYLSLPNPSTTVNGKKFTVSAHLSVSSTPATSKLPPSLATPFGPVLNVPVTGVVPAISIGGPDVLQLAADASQVRLIVESSGEGSVTAAFGSVSLGSAGVRPGENDLRFSVPKGTLSAIRRAMALGATTLTLTPTSPDGTATGPPVTQKILVIPAKAVVLAKQAPKKIKASAKTTKTRKAH